MTHAIRRPAAWWLLLTLCLFVAPLAAADGSGTPLAGECILIGKGIRYTPQASGYLYCFANDAWKFYDNNRGKVTLTVRRLR